MTKHLTHELCVATALAAGLLLTPAALAQQQGVSHPPPDDTIQATQDAPQQPSQAKPSPSAPVVQAYPPPASKPALSATDDPNSPDYGIVTSVPSGNSANQSPVYGPSSRDAHLITRPENPDYGIVEVVPSPSNQLAEGTDIRVRLLQNLSTSATRDGATFRGQVAADVYKEGRVVIPVGSELRGRVVSVTQGHRLGSPATMRLRPEAVVLPDGTAYHLYAQAVRTDAPGTRTDDEGGIQPSSRVTKNLVEVGAGTGGGAATGAVLGGPAGAAAGALVGAGIVTAHLLIQHPHEARVEQGSEITFSLTEPMDLLPTRN
jgi:hypothetical protein